MSLYTAKRLLLKGRSIIPFYPLPKTPKYFLAQPLHVLKNKIKVAMLRLDVLASGNLKSIAIFMKYTYFMHFDFMHSAYMCYYDIFLLLTAVDCGTLNNPANGQVSHTGRTTYRQTATYSCDTGYNLVGVSTRTCQATGAWSGSVPTCQGMLLLKLE